MSTDPRALKTARGDGNVLCVVAVISVRGDVLVPLGMACVLVNLLVDHEVNLRSSSPWDRGLNCVAHGSHFFQEPARIVTKSQPASVTLEWNLNFKR